MSEQFPLPEAQPSARKPRRWPWIVGLIAALFVGVGAGAAGAGREIPADDNPTVQARLSELTELQEAADERAAEREQGFEERAEELDRREAEIAKQAEALDERESDLDERKASLDERASALDEREQSISAEETEIAENTVPGNGVYVVGEDIKAGTYKTAGPDSSGSCYYAFKSGTGSDAEIIDNNIVQGQATVSLSSGQVFETSGCSDWKRQ